MHSGAKTKQTGCLIAAVVCVILGILGFAGVGGALLLLRRQAYETARMEAIDRQAHDLLETLAARLDRFWVAPPGFAGPSWEATPEYRRRKQATELEFPKLLTENPWLFDVLVMTEDQMEFLVSGRQGSSFAQRDRVSRPAQLTAAGDTVEVADLLVGRDSTPARAYTLFLGHTEPSGVASGVWLVVFARLDP